MLHFSHLNSNACAASIVAVLLCHHGPYEAVHRGIPRYSIQY
jgi:hypothetical protein